MSDPLYDQIGIGYSVYRRPDPRIAARVDADPAWERLAPVPLATVCLRYRQGPEERLDAVNAAILERVNASGRIFLSHTRLRDRFTLRVSVGNPRTTEAHLDLCWKLLQEAAKGILGTCAP